MSGYGVAATFSAPNLWLESLPRDQRIRLEVEWIFESLSQPHVWDLIYTWTIANRDHPSDRADREYRAQRRRDAEGRPCECGCGQRITEMRGRLRRYLKGHNCQSKERNARKAEAREKRCSLDGCNNEIPNTLKMTTRKYCSDRCRRKAESRRAWKRELERRA
jgi:hypothetical protein